MSKSTWTGAVVIIAVAAIAAVAWRMGRSSAEAEARSIVPSSPSSGTPPDASRTELVAPIDLPREPDEVETAPSDADHAAPQPVDGSSPVYPWHSESPRLRTPPEVFEQRFADRTPEEIIVLAALSLDKHKELLGPAFEERLERGLFFPKARDENLVRLGPSDPLVRMYDQNDPDHVKLVWLPYDEYPGIYESSDEHFWLQRKARKLKEQAKAAAASAPK